MYMRRILLTLLCVTLLVLPALAADGETQIVDMKTEILVAEDSSCSVTHQFVVAFSGNEKTFMIPLGEDASDYSTGVMAEEVERNGVKCLRMTSSVGFSGQQNFTVSYRLPVQIAAFDEEGQELTLPVLAAGFPCPITQWTVTIRFPKELETVPVLISGSHGETAFNDFESKTEGSTYTAKLLTQMNENDSLRLQVTLPADFFDLRNLPGQVYTPSMIAFCVLAGLGLLYWFFCLRNRLPVPDACKLPLPNITAGEVGFHLTCDTPDIAALIAHWANLGYLTIWRTATGRTVLHREMTMGNERRPVESRLFQALFRRDGNCEVQSVRYRNAAKRMRRPFRAHCAKRMFDRKSGNVKLVQILGALASYAVGFCAFDQILGVFSARWVLIPILAVSYGLLAWLVQSAVVGLMRRNRRRALGRGLAALFVMLLLGRWGRVGLLSVGNGLFQILVGLMAMPGGRRSKDGMELLNKLLGYRRYLATVSGAELAEAMEQNPQFLYQALPYAEAFGIERQLIRHSAGLRPEVCPWLKAEKGVPTEPERFCALYQSVMTTLRQEDEPGLVEGWIRGRLARRRRAAARKAGRHAAPRARRQVEKAPPQRPRRSNPPEPQQPAYVRPHRRVQQTEEPVKK